MATRLLSLEKAMISGETTLKNEVIDENENVSSLKGMLYSIPNSINKNRNIHNLFMNFDNEKDDKKSERESINVQGSKIRNLILTKQDKNAKGITDTAGVYNPNITENENEEENSKSDSKEEIENYNYDNLYNYDDKIEDDDDKSEEEIQEENEKDEYSTLDDDNDNDNDYDYDDDYDDNYSDDDYDNDYDDGYDDDYDDDDDYDYDDYDDYDDDKESEEYSEEDDDIINDIDLTEYEVNGNKDEEYSGEAEDDFLEIIAKNSTSDKIRNINEPSENKPTEKTKENKQTEKNEKEKPSYQWQDSNDIRVGDNKDDEIDEDAINLRKTARDIANLEGSYGMATEDGINKLSNLLDEVLKYSSKISQRTNPIKELIRNFNSIKTIQKGLVGNEKELNIVATNIDEIKKNANEVSRLRAAQISMQKTYLSKIIAINRFEYSEEVETMLRNALFDMHDNISKSKSEDDLRISNNVGRILLPLLRTKNEPMNYNYDFQYDILKEIIRQEDFFSEFDSKSAYEDVDDKSLKVDPISSFILLRYLKTILNYRSDNESNNEKNNKDDYLKVPQKECFKGDDKALEKTFNALISKNKDVKDELNAGGEYLKYGSYLTYFAIFANSNNLKDLIGKANEKINKSYNIVKQKLLQNPVYETTNIGLSDIRKALTDLYEKIKNKNKGKNLSDKLYTIIKNIGNPEKLMEACDQEGKLKDFERQYKEVRKKSENSNQAAPKTTDTPSATATT